MKIKRPDWTKQLERKKSKKWIDKNENSDELLAKVNITNLKSITLNDIFAYPDLGKLYLVLSKNLKINYKKILLTNGADGAIKLVFDTLYNKKKFTILRFEPSFAMYKIYSKLYSTKDIVVDYKNIKGEPNLNLLLVIQKIKKFKPNLILLANPNSPTGTLINSKQLENIIKIAKNNNCFVLLDEAYFPYSKLSFINKVNKYKNLIIVRSLKAFGLSGMRVGYLISNVDLLEKISSYRPMYEINSLGAFLFLKLLKNYSIVKKSVNRLLSGKNYFTFELKKRNIEFIKSYGNFIHIKIKKNREKILKNISKKLYIRNNETHNSLKGFSRISLTTKQNYKYILQILDKYKNEK